MLAAGDVDVTADADAAVVSTDRHRPPRTPVTRSRRTPRDASATATTDDNAEAAHAARSLARTPPLGQRSSGQAGGPDPSSMVAVWTRPRSRSTRPHLVAGLVLHHQVRQLPAPSDTVLPSTPTMVSPASMPAASAPEPDCTSLTRRRCRRRAAGRPPSRRCRRRDRRSRVSSDADARGRRAWAPTWMVSVPSPDWIFLAIGDRVLDRDRVALVGALATEAEPAVAARCGRVHADDVAVGVDQRATGVTGLDVGVDLDEVVEASRRCCRPGRQR